MSMFVKSIRPDGTIEGQFEVVDETGLAWRASGNDAVRDTPWPELEFVRVWIVSDKAPSGENKEAA